jgi:hypothetical protein
MQQPYRVGLVSLAITLAGAFVWPTETHAVKCLVCTACHNKCDQRFLECHANLERLGISGQRWPERRCGERYQACLAACPKAPA